MTAVMNDDRIAEMYRQKQDGLVRWAYALTGSLETAHDVVQDAFVALQENCATVEDPHAYVKQVVVNRCRKIMMLGYRLPVDTLSSEVSTPLLFDVDLWKAIQRLHGEQRMVIVLRYLDDLPISDIAHQLGKSESSAKATLHRALVKLRKELHV
jgi:DNA-directed RNA polymerase specialized sigma24 family protein